MLFKSEVLTQASGSIGGVTYSHNRSGMYRRARAVPVNPSTPFQEQVRSGLTSAVTRWTEALAAAQRATWDLYAANVTVTNPLGDQINLSGQNMYIRSQTVLEQLTLKLGVVPGSIDVYNTAPSIFDLGAFTTPTVTADVSAGLLFAITAADEWANEDGSFMIVSMGRPQNASVNFYAGPWRALAAIPGDSVSPPSPPVTVNPAAIAANGYPFVVGQKVWARVRVLRADGRLSTERILTPSIAIA